MIIETVVMDIWESMEGKKDGSNHHTALWAVSGVDRLTEEVYDKLYRYALEERKLRAGKFFHRQDAYRCVAADVLARCCIASFFGISIDEICYDTNKYGKPFVKKKRDAYFNISHAGQWVVCAVSTCVVGVDVERIKPTDLAIAKRFFASQEYQFLVSLPSHLHSRYFYAYWTLKESFIKALGKGLSCPLDHFVICIEKDHIHMKTTYHLPHMCFRQYDLDPEYAFACCLACDAFPGTIRTISPAELLALYEELI